MDIGSTPHSLIYYACKFILQNIITDKDRYEIVALFNDRRSLWKQHLYNDQAKEIEAINLIIVEKLTRIIVFNFAYIFLEFPDLIMVKTFIRDNIKLVNSSSIEAFMFSECPTEYAEYFFYARQCGINTNTRLPSLSQQYTWPINIDDKYNLKEHYLRLKVNTMNLNIRFFSCLNEILIRQKIELGKSSSLPANFSLLTTPYTENSTLNLLPALLTYSALYKNKMTETTNSNLQSQYTEQLQYLLTITIELRKRVQLLLDEYMMIRLIFNKQITILLIEKTHCLYHYDVAAIKALSSSNNLPLGSINFTFTHNCCNAHFLARSTTKGLDLLENAKKIRKILFITKLLLHPTQITAFPHEYKDSESMLPAGQVQIGTYAYSEPICDNGNNCLLFFHECHCSPNLSRTGPVRDPGITTTLNTALQVRKKEKNTDRHTTCIPASNDLRTKLENIIAKTIKEKCLLTENINLISIGSDWLALSRIIGLLYIEHGYINFNIVALDIVPQLHAATIHTFKIEDLPALASIRFKPIAETTSFQQALSFLFPNSKVTVYYDGINKEISKTTLQSFARSRSVFMFAEDLGKPKRGYREIIAKDRSENWMNILQDKLPNHIIYGFSMDQTEEDICTTENVTQSERFQKIIQNPNKH